MYMYTSSYKHYPNIISTLPNPSMYKRQVSSKHSPLLQPLISHVSAKMDPTRESKVLVIVGPTGSGKSKLSIDLATRFFPGSEIINSDKMQLYRGLDITTNKMPVSDRRGVPHHLLGVADPETEVPAAAFRSAAAAVIAAVTRRNNLPVLVGGSNSIIYALLSNRFETGSGFFDPVRSELRYECCFIWVDVAMSVLDEYLIKRVDDMFDSGMLAELTRFFKEEGFGDSAGRVGLRKAIGVPEFESYFRRYLNAGEEMGNDWVRRGAYEEGVRLIKDNTCQLARAQGEKIQRLRRKAGWEMNRVDATAAFKAALVGDDVAGIWERQVLVPSVKIVSQFLEE